jgi:hypothetical protein
MAEQLLQDPRLTLAGAGFLGDPEAQDGIHLRWSFDPDLGFPADGFRLFFRPAARAELRKVSFAPLAQQLEAQPAPAGVADGVTVHRADGRRLEAGRRCDQVGLDLGSTPLVLRFRPSFGTPPGPVRRVTVFGVAERGAVSVRALHAGRVADCAASGFATCLRRIIDERVTDDLTRLAGAEVMLAGRNARRRLRGRERAEPAEDERVGRRAGGANLHGFAALMRADRASALDNLRDSGFQPAAANCTPFQLTVEADAIDEVQVSGCDAVLVGALWSPIAADESERGWKLLRGPICLPVDAVAGYPCALEAGSARDVAKNRLPEQADLPAGAPTRLELEKQLLGADFDELRASLEHALDAGGQLVTRLPAEDPEDGTTWRYDVVRDALTAAADPYFARVLGLYWVHPEQDPNARHDYMIEASWPIDGEKRRLCWIVYDRGLEAQPALPVPANVAATARIGAAHMTPDGVLNPFEMDVTVDWRRPSVCELTDPVRSPIAYLLERTAVDAPAAGPYELISRRRFEPGGEFEVVPAIIADPDEGEPRFATGYFVDRGPGYGTFHYRVLGRDLFGRTSGPSTPGSVDVSDQVAPGPPLNLAAEYADPADPDRAGGALLGWANRDVPAGAPSRAGVAVRWIWPASRRLQFPDLDEFRLYYRPGTLNHVLGRIESVSEAAAGEYDVTTDIAPVGPDFPVAQAGVDLGALRSEGEECPILTLATVGGALRFRVLANPAAPPLVGAATFRLGRGTSPTATRPARAPYPAFRSFEQAADWEGFLADPTAAPPLPLRIAADGTLRQPLPGGLTANDVDVTRETETIDGEEHWHYRLTLRGVDLLPTLERPRTVGTFGVGSVDAAGNEGRIAPPASIVATWRTPPNVPAIVYPPVNFATPADYHGSSWFSLTWTAKAGIGYQVYRAMDLELLAAAGIELADHLAKSDDEQRLQLQQLALDLAHIEAFRLVTATPLEGAGGGPMRHRDALPGGLRNRFVYRIRAVDRAGNLAPWPAAPPAATCVIVDVPAGPPAPPVWAEAAFPAGGGITLRWVPNGGTGLAGYRLYRADDAASAGDVRSMTPLFAAPQAEGGGEVTGVVLTRDVFGAVTNVQDLPAGDATPGRLVQYLDNAAPVGRAVYYRLVAQDAQGQRSAASARLVVQLPKRQPPEAPVWVAPILAPGEVALAWTAEPELECLVLRRGDAPLWRALGPWAPPGDYARVDDGVTPGTEYEYRVRVRDSVGHVVDGPILNVTAI